MQSVYLNSMQVLTILNWLTVITGLLLFLILQVSLHNSAFQTCYGSLESGVVITSNLILDVIISPIIIIVPLSWSSNESSIQYLWVGSGVVIIVPATACWSPRAGSGSMMRSLWRIITESYNITPATVSQHVMYLLSSEVSGLARDDSSISSNQSDKGSIS